MPFVILGIVALAGASVFLLYRKSSSGDAAQLDEVSTTVQKIAEPSGGAGGGSSANKPRSVRDHNPTNLRYISKNPFNGQIGNDGGYGIYETDALGCRAAFLNLYNYFKANKDTLREIISTWAPSSENPTEAYIGFMSQWVRVSADQQLDYHTHAVKIVQGMARFETGFEAWPLSFFQQGFNDAGK